MKLKTQSSIFEYTTLDPPHVVLRVHDELARLALQSVLTENNFVLLAEQNESCIVVTDDRFAVSDRSVLVVNETAIGAKHALLLLHSGVIKSAIPRDLPRDLPLAIELLVSGFMGMPAVLLHRAEAAPDLEKRDLDVLTLLIAGSTNADIAREMQVSEASAKRYVSLLMDRFNASSRVDLAQQATRVGFGS